MASRNPKDRVSLCSFTYADGRRCRLPRSSNGTPGISNQPHLCSYHARKEARALAAEKIGEDLNYFFSARYLSANDLNTALARIIPAVIRGEINPRTARVVAYLVHTLSQTLRISQDEYINAFGTDGWRHTVHHSVKANHEYCFPSEDQPESEASESEPPQPQSTQPREAAAPTPAASPAPAAAPVASLRRTAPSAPIVPERTSSVQTAPASPRPSPQTQPAAAPQHSSTTPPAASSPQPKPVAQTDISSAQPAPAQSTQRTDQSSQAAPQPSPNIPPPNNPPSANPQSRRNITTKDPYAVHFDVNYRLSGF